MKAVTQDRYGAPGEVLALEDLDPPVLGDGDVLVQVHAAGVDPGVWHQVRGEAYVARLAFGLRRPKVRVPGRDLAGTVAAVGAGVTRFRPGDRVYAEVDTGSFAEYAGVPETRLAHAPTNLTLEQAAAVPISANTALQALRDAGTLRPGQRVLVNGAAGGVGTFAVQLATSLGAEVTGVCGTANVALVRSLGAGHVVDYTREDFTRDGRRYDLILDLIGNRSLADCRRALTPTGTLVLSSGAGGRWLGPAGRILRALVLTGFVRQRLRTLVAKPSRADLATLTALIESGEVTPVIDRTYPLPEAAAAIGYVEAGHARGKVVLTI